MTASIFKLHYSISEMLQRPSLLPSSFGAFPPPPPPTIHPHVIYPPLSNIEVGTSESKEEVGEKRIVGKKRDA